MRRSRRIRLFAAAVFAAGGACAQDAETDAKQAQWNAYLDRVGVALRASGEPRDWALAATIYRKDTEPPPDAAALLGNAAKAAPDDALVQWAYLTHHARSPGTCGRDGADPERLQRLTEREPDNAATWVLRADAALRAGDDDTADRLLERAAAASAFDDRLSASIDAWHAVFRRLPPPFSNPAFAEADSPERPVLEAVAFGEAVSQGCNSPVLDAMTSIRKACDASLAAATDPRRYAYCAEIGQRMRGAKTGVVQLMGHRLLHESGLESEADAAAFYDLYDLYQRARELDALSEDPAEVARMLDDWRTTGGDETEVLRRQLRRAGVSTAASNP